LVERVLHRAAEALEEFQRGDATSGKKASM
jgi:hypothetical protein